MFGTGRCVLTGLKTMDEIIYLFRQFLQKAVNNNNNEIFW